jgi:hypothetical protein
MRIAKLFILMSLGMVMVACTEIRHEVAESSARNMQFQLHEAGFKILLADNQERQNLLNGLPPETLSRLPLGGIVYYMYPDPVVCSCLYVGREQEFKKLQQLGIDLQRSNQALLIHEMGETEQAGFGPAGPFGNYGLWPLTNPNGMGRPGWDPS